MAPMGFLACCSTQASARTKDSSKARASSVNTSTLFNDETKKSNETPNVKSQEVKQDDKSTMEGLTMIDTTV